MNENLDLTKILKDAPKGTKLWSPICGDCVLDKIDTTDTTMLITNNSWNTKVCLLEIKKWCYIDDLLPNEGEK